MFEAIIAQSRKNEKRKKTLYWPFVQDDGSEESEVGENSENRIVKRYEQLQ